MKIAIIFDIFGPYHRARAQGAAKVFSVTAIEVFERNKEYPWHISERGGTIDHIRVLPDVERQIFSRRALIAGIRGALDSCAPDVVAIPGWSDQWALAALVWCQENNISTILMSESTEWDEARSAWREAVKRRIVGMCSAALVGGTPHKDYMLRLGMPAERVFLGYDAVDNGYFADKVAEVRSAKCGMRSKYDLPENYFLASARFVEKKNLPRLIEAYARYRALAAKVSSQKSVVSGQPGEVERQTLHGPGKAENTSPRPFPQSGEGDAPWDLVLLGDGPLLSSLKSQVSSLNLQDSVHLPGFKQYPDLPVYYAHAGAFIHASTTEQWGLVVNEAMASGLPVLVSNRCGCAADLVQDGVNGFTFDPYDVEQIAQLMFQVSGFRFQVSEFGDASRAIISEWGPERFASGLKSAAECALKVGPKRAGIVDRLILRALSLR